MKSHLIYETDNIERAREVASSNPDVSVVYHNPNAKISPVLTSIIGGRKFTQRNPEYVKYLKQKYPGISEQDINKCIKEAINESLLETNTAMSEIDQSDLSQDIRKR